MKRWVPASVLLGLGVLLLLYGLFRSEHLTVMRKAIAICLECIGIG